jgi:hypothetical protein
MHKKPPERLLYLSPSPLSNFAQRPHHFVHWFHHKYQAPVMWIDPGPSRLPRWSDGPRLVNQIKQVKNCVMGGVKQQDLGPRWRTEKWLQHVSAHVLPLEPFVLGRIINQMLWKQLLQTTDRFVDGNTVLVMGKPCALALALAKRYPQNHCVFDTMDNMPGFYSGPSRQWMSKAQTQQAERAHTIWASSSNLAHIHAAEGDKVSLVLNALTLPPANIWCINAKRSKKPVLGYLGVIDRWFDWSLIRQLASRYPQAQIQLIGPMHSQPTFDLPANVQCLPAVAQHDVYKAMGQFDVGLIPFEINDVTRYVDPVKYYEYKAMGLPVLSTRFGEMTERKTDPGVFFWDDLQEGRTDLSTLVYAKASEEDRQRFCLENTWQKRFDENAHSLSF